MRWMPANRLNLLAWPLAADQRWQMQMRMNGYGLKATD